MTLKTWVLGRVQRGGAVLGRPDLPARDGAAPSSADSSGAPRPRESAHAVEHLGLYAALVGAIRDELEHFMASHVQLHLAIADHDRFVLTSIHVACPDDAQARQLLQQFMREFKPEQVKRYLAREVIAALPNASAIDLSQFAGLLDADSLAEQEDEGDYAELLAALRGPESAPQARAYEVHIMGRWTERDAAARAGEAPAAAAMATTTGARCDFDVEDAEGKRRVVLHGVVPGRRYIIGKDASSDIRVNGTYTSRRHAELWLEGGAWQVGDAGSTNGLRVESARGPTQRLVPSGESPHAARITLQGHERIVLSAHAQGAPGDYPAISLRIAGPDLAARVTPIAVALSSKTPVTPLRAAAVGATSTTAVTDAPSSTTGLDAAYELRVHGAAGARSLPLTAANLPVSVGRSRHQTLVIGRAHEMVSGHHLDIVAVDESGVQLQVHGHNGVLLDGEAHAAGACVRWRPGQTLVLGPILPEGRACALSLARRD